ncbi:hypothetical protein DWG18_02990 [Lysobacter sp. TY2-98]|uniref:hypothetical protein n=1 Tax=Lysobacter sp. TY2-98 TaxID=2290922 RepID=UPI000E205A15|nr:hypothetical protein [Lysobacter sp. TY2-98]AXK71357.1 hypothetical protein DWG18_02990 [Lysobacter sp. TY2-98]
MSHPSHRLLIALTFALALTACSRDKGDATTPTNDTPNAATPASSASTRTGEDSATATTSDAPAAPNPRAPAAFTCDNGSKVDIADLVAVVTLNDGRTVQIARDPDDAFHFQGEALSFRMKDGQGELAPDEGAISRCAGG